MEHDLQDSIVDTEFGFASSWDRDLQDTIPDDYFLPGEDCSCLSNVTATRRPAADDCVSSLNVKFEALAQDPQGEGLFEGVEMTDLYQVEYEEESETGKSNKEDKNDKKNNKNKDDR